MAKNLSGVSFQDNYGNITQIITKLTKSKWLSEFAMNKSVSNSYLSLFNGNKVQVAQISAGVSFKKFITKLKKTTKLTNFTEKFGDFDEMMEFGYEGNGNGTFKRVHFCDNVVEFLIDDVELTLVPWHDGVMIQSITVPNQKRNTGIGTKIMNILYDVSELTEVPLYLIPYPGEQFNPKDEFKLVNKLRVWYSNLGFGKAVESTKDVWPHVWCNME